MARNLGLLSSLPVRIGPTDISSKAPSLVTLIVLVFTHDQNKLLNYDKDNLE